MTEYFNILRPQVERLKEIVDGTSMPSADRTLLRQNAATSIEVAEQRQEISRQQRDELIKLLYPFEVLIFPCKRL